MKLKNLRKIVTSLKGAPGTAEILIRRIDDYNPNWRNDYKVEVDIHTGEVLSKNLDVKEVEYIVFYTQLG